MNDKRLAIRSIGIAAGEVTRPNSWWDREIVDTWRSRAATRRAGLTSARERLASPLQRRVADLMLEIVDDPFIGIERRSVHREDGTALELELAAARDAIARADVSPASIDLLITHSFYPDLLATNLATSVHHGLGLDAACLAFGLESASNSFVHQLAIAEGLIRVGRAKRALLVQSSIASRYLPKHLDHASWFGDMATAVVVSGGSDDTGLLGIAHTTDGSTQGSLVAGTPGKRWHESGPAILYSLSADARDQMFFSVLEGSAVVADMLFASIPTKRGDVDFFVSHQAFPWLRRESQQATGVGHAAFIETFPWTGNIVSCGVPYQLGSAERAGLLQKGQNVLIWSGGSGMTNCAAALRWSGT